MRDIPVKTINHLALLMQRMIKSSWKEFKGSLEKHLSYVVEELLGLLLWRVYEDKIMEFLSFLQKILSKFHFYLHKYDLIYICHRFVWGWKVYSKLQKSNNLLLSLINYDYWPSVHFVISFVRWRNKVINKMSKAYIIAI